MTNNLEGQILNIPPHNICFFLFMVFGGGIKDLQLSLCTLRYSITSYISTVLLYHSVHNKREVE